MKKSNLITFLSFCLMILAVLAVIAIPRFRKPAQEDTALSVPAETTVSESAESSEPSVSGTVSETTPETVPEPMPETVLPAETTVPAVTETSPAPTESSVSAASSDSMEHALFIGDSRTVGLMDYASSLDDADFFADLGMTVFNVDDQKLSVPSVGKVTLEDLLTGKKYDKIYIMLGINEAGYVLNDIIDNYQALVTRIQELQPDAVLFLQANLHVTEERSAQDSVINNPVIDRINLRISRLADGKRTFFLDINSVFDDENHNLNADKAGDNAHLYGKYYIDWGDWIRDQTAVIWKENSF